MNSGKSITHAIGLMSGTSADGVDGVILDILENEEFRIADYENLAYPAYTRKKIRKITAKRIETSAHSDGLDIELAAHYAKVAISLVSRASNRPVSVIGCHGQTVNHSPESDPPFTLQLGDGKTLAKLTGIPVVTDFRSADMAAGGQGAPLAPAFHHAAFSSREEARAVINIGGISNITLLPQVLDERHSPDNVTGFDTGPGNTLIDYWCRTHFGCEYDNNGDIARLGTLQLDLLDIFIRDKYFTQSPPKSTGLEYFNPTWLKGKLGLWEGAGQCSNEDVLATLTALTAKCISDQINQAHPPVVSAYVCGGGSRNTLLLEMMQLNTKASIHNTGALGIDPQLVEAAAFAWMGYRTLHGLPSTLPSVTGARKSTVAGVVHLPT